MLQQSTVNTTKMEAVLTTTQKSFPLEHLISQHAQKRFSKHFSVNKTSKDIVPHPHPISLGAGVPHYGFFPVKAIKVELLEEPFAQEATHLPTPNGSSDNLTKSFAAGAGSFTVPQVTDDPSEIDLRYGLQYAAIEGLPPLVNYTREFVERCFPPAFQDWATIITNGAGNGLNKACDLFLDEGDTLLIEEFTFTPILATVRDLGASPYPVKLDFDADGIDVKALDHLLANWKTVNPQLKFPKALYTIANGQNPLGLVATRENKLAIYALAEKYDFAIIEDDPYGYLALPPYQPNREEEAPLTIDEFISKFDASYLTIDHSGRVVRVETFSKIYAPGLRLGFIVAHQSFIHAIAEYSNISTRSPSGPSQILVNNAIRHWGGIDGWLAWILKVRGEYVKRRDVMLDTLFQSQASHDGYIKVIDPQAGMFVSVVLNLGKVPVERSKYEATMSRLVEKTVENGVTIVVGPNMCFSESAMENSNFVRLTIAATATHEELAEAARRFAKSVSDLFAELLLEEGEKV